MERMNPPNLAIPALCSLFAGIFFLAARSQQQDNFFKGVFILFGVILAAVALATGLDWLVFKISQVIREMREAIYAPQIQLARAIGGMNASQLALMGHLNVINVEARMMGGKLTYWLRISDSLSIPYSWIAQYLEDCVLGYPDMIPQHGYSDSINRQYIQAFTNLMTRGDNNLAIPAAGNKPAQWIVPLSDVAKRLGFEE